MSKKVDSVIDTASVTGVAMAVAVMLKPMQEMANAEKALDRKRGATWQATIEAAACFPQDMSESARTQLSGELARAYVRFYKEGDAAKVAASQHAKAIWCIATRAAGPDGAVVNPSAHTSMKGYMAALRGPRQQADAGHAGTVSDSRAEGTMDATAAAVEQAIATPANAFSTSGLSVEVGGAVVRIIEAAKRSPELADGVLFMANNLDMLAGFADYVIAAKLAGKFGADKVKRAA